MAKKRTLRTLSSEVPDADTVEVLLLKLHEQEDRAAAIVGASLVESALQDLIVRSLHSARSGLETSLFENRGPMSDFNGKIVIAQAFGIITDRLADDLQRIRRIRNCFAHARVEVTFNEPLIAKEVSDLAAVIAVRVSMAKYPNSYPPNYDSPKTSYGLSCFITQRVLVSEALPPQ